MGLRDRALLELLYAPGCASARPSRSTATTSRSSGGFVRVIGKGDRERLVPVGDVAVEAIDAYLAERDRGPRGSAWRV